MRQKYGVNFVRIEPGDNEVWWDAADEVGILVFHGRYGAPRGSINRAPPKDFGLSLEAYKSEYFEAQARHPSIVTDFEQRNARSCIQRVSCETMLGAALWDQQDFASATRDLVVGNQVTSQTLIHMLAGMVEHLLMSHMERQSARSITSTAVHSQ